MERCLIELKKNKYILFMKFSCNQNLKTKLKIMAFLQLKQVKSYLFKKSIKQIISSQFNYIQIIQISYFDMFENLKQHINRENLQAIKKKNRYLEEQNDSDEEQEDIHLKHLKSKTSPIQKPPKSNNPFFQTDKKTLSQSQDSLSDYELHQRQQAFIKLTSQPQIQFSPIEKQKLTFTNTYFTPESKIKQLQRSVELSQEKLKLAQEYHSRQMSTMSQKHDRTVRQLNLEVKKLKLTIENSNQKETRINQITKENAKLRETLAMYEQKYWKFQDVQNIKNRLQTESKVLKLQNLQLKDLISQIQSAHRSKESVSEPKKIQQNPQLQQLSHKIHQLTKTISSLEKKLTDSYHQNELDKLFYEQKIKSFERKIQELEDNLKQKQRQLTECMITCDKLKAEKETVQKSLLHTMESFSKHLSNESLNQQNNLALTTQINRSVSYSGNKKDFRRSSIHEGKGTSYNQPTINLDEQENMTVNYQQNQQKNKDLSEVSPVPIKRVTFEEPHIAQFDLPQPRQRTRVMSYHMAGTSIKPSKTKHINMSTIRNGYDMDKMEQSRVVKLEKKLEEANQKIVELLREKISRATQPNISLLLR